MGDGAVGRSNPGAITGIVPAPPMFKRTPVLIAFFLAFAAPALRAVDPIPESQQAALVLKLLDVYHGPRPATPPKKLHVVYFTPSDLEPEPRYRERLDAIMEDI